MNREAREHNETITPNSAQIKRLRAAFPEYFDEQGSFMLDRFEQMLREDDLNLTREGYELKFLGKSYAKYLAGLETETVVVPDLEHNAEPENKDSENLYIVGDNLDALQHLVKSYTGKVKCIYIDPPYNTGSDGFVYNDDFGFTAQQLVERIGISEDEAERILDMQGKSSHSAWLTFMYPRLVLARELLSDDGVIFISIDGNEQANLQLLCFDIFGEENEIGTVSVAKGTTTGQDAGDLGSSIDYLQIFAKNKQLFQLNRLPLSTEDAKRFNEQDEKGKYSTLQFRKTGNNDRREDRPKLYYSLSAPDGTEVFPIGPGGYESRWRAERKTYLAWETAGLIVWKKNKEARWNPYVKYYLEGRLKNVSNLWTDIPFYDETLWDDIEGNKKATHTIKGLFGEAVFTNPKPVGLLERIVQIGADSESLVLDFFSGSATTAHAVLRMNAQDSGNRRCIMVQLPEQIEENKPAYKSGYKTIDEIGRERIKRAAAKIKEETGADIDYGFKLVRLESPSVKTLDELDAFDPSVEDLLAGDYVSKFDLDGTPGREVVLTTWLNQDGFGLLAKPRKVELAGYVLDVCEDSAYVIDSGITSDDVQELVRLLEANELQLSRVVVFPYSVTFSVMHELKKNLAVLKSGQSVEVIERF
ncbi:DNA methyltransferase [Actinotignum sp. GS-2025f]|uniref:site-specific DNA-methyltransferase n=1 Tax=unclassified Actinotignum TaxID=2632702 RepID=UPI002A802C95|nr:DNA methyltransferase [Actinotignum sp. SLA_B059]MDY5128217.1 DNA methyltransferase [Actinotignum sp. SLA_B059]